MIVRGRVAGATLGRFTLGMGALGRAVGADGAVLDGGAPLRDARIHAFARAPLPAQRGPVDTPAWTGIRAIDGLLTLGRGARVGIFGAPGTGKSTLLDAIVRGCRCDAIVTGLVGERGREAERWIERLDGRTTIVIATSDRSAAERVAAARVSAAQAAALCERGLHVLWLLDSLARVAAALRELGVAAGESTGRGGFPPSTFAEIAKLVEVAGVRKRGGSITLIASVLDDGDARDPVSDAARSLLDGHLTLSAKIASAGRYPALDVPDSASRTMEAVTGADHRRAARIVRAALAALEETHDARVLGIEPAGLWLQRAVAHLGELEAFLRQDASLGSPAATLAALARLADTLGEPHGHY